jgi:hypothetical protein
MDNRRFTAPVDEIEGTVESATPAGVTLREYPGRVFRFSSVGTSAADMSARVLGENNRLNREELAEEVNVRRGQMFDWLADVARPGSSARLIVPRNAAYGSEDIRAVISVEGRNLNQGSPSCRTTKASRARARDGGLSGRWFRMDREIRT